MNLNKLLSIVCFNYCYRMVFTLRGKKLRGQIECSEGQAFSASPNFWKISKILMKNSILTIQFRKFLRFGKSSTPKPQRRTLISKILKKLLKNRVKQMIRMTKTGKARKANKAYKYPPTINLLTN